jgi:release factor glutamine methyltransferase
MFATPDLSHLTRHDYEHIYEPDADSFLLLDALELRHRQIVEHNPLIVLEFGTGSGLATSFLAKHFCSSYRLFFAIDINSHACQVTQRTFTQNHLMNKHSLEIVRCNLADPLIDRLSSKVDLMLFNPPYVPTETANVDEMIERTYAGGEHGCEVINIAIEQASRLLSSHGLFYMVALEENNFERIKQFAERLDFNVDIVLKRRTLIERLLVIQFEKK